MRKLRHSIARFFMDISFIFVDMAFFFLPMEDQEEVKKIILAAFNKVNREKEGVENVISH